MMWSWGTSVPWWGWLLGCVSMLVLLGLVIWAIWSVVTQPGSRTVAELPGPDHLLDVRFARGEIDFDEYQHERRALAAPSRPLEGSGR